MKTVPIDTDIPVPGPLQDTAPHDRFCDLILNGGVASGIVYPWALVELARHYRFRSIGGNSVGAMAAALAAAAEYGRCNGDANAFEVLRRAPLDLAEEQDGRAKMLRLFQPSPPLRRLFEAGLVVIRLGNRPAPPEHLPWLRRCWAKLRRSGTAALVGAKILDVYGLLPWLLLWLPGAWTLWLLLSVLPPAPHVAAMVLSALGWLVVIAIVIAVRVGNDLRALAANDYGICRGKAQPPAPDQQPTEEALMEWLHRGIQLSAGRGRDDPPLTFADLWNAPRGGRSPTDAHAAADPSIELQMFSTNITLGRPVSWPLMDRGTRLFFREEDWRLVFPDVLVNAVLAVARPYAPASDSDPRADQCPAGFYEIPAGELPIAVAARMSLCFPFLFTCMRVYALDYEGERGQRSLRRCLMTDGGLCTNFPIHLFDAAHPRWPTFGLMLSRRLRNYKTQPVWLPEFHQDGRADSWSRNVPGAELGPPRQGVSGLALGMLTTAMDWSDNLTSRLPHVRNRVLRMGLQPGEGQLNIAMPGKTILRMAHDYGTLGGLLLVSRFVAPAGKPTEAWREHLYVRTLNQLRALREHLRGFGRAVSTSGYSTPCADILLQASKARPLRVKAQRPADGEGGQLTGPQAAALQRAVDAVGALELALEHCDPETGPYQPMPAARLGLRSRL